MATNGRSASVNYDVRMNWMAPKAIADAVELAARRQMISRSAYMRGAVAERLRSENENGLHRKAAD